MSEGTDPALGDTVRWTERRDGQLRTLTGTVHAAHPDRWLVNLGAGKYYDLRRDLWEAAGEIAERAARPRLVAVPS